MNAVIIEDEAIIATELKEAIAEVADDVEVIAILHSIKSAQKWFTENGEPDLLFMDIQLGDGVSFEILDQFHFICPVIFTTAYDEYAIRAFRTNGVDYLLKPVEITELKAAIDKCRRFVASDKNKTSASSENMERLLSQLAGQKPAGKIALSTLDGLILVDVDTILYCESENTYTKFFFTDKHSITISKVLKEAEALLGGKDFCRVHNSFLVNMKYVQRYIRGNGGEVIMQDGKSIPVSKSRRLDFLKRLEKL